MTLTMPVPQTLPPIAGQPLSVVLLAQNASAHVEALLLDWLTWLDARNQEYELILVDDGSSDGTADRAGAIADKSLRLRVLRHDEPKGEGAALRTGVAAASKPLLFCSLCRPDHRPEQLGQLLDKPTALEGGGKEIDQVHLITGFRAATPVPLGVRIVSVMWRIFCRLLFSYRPMRLPGWLGWRGHAGWLLARIVFALRTHDVGCPVRLYRREIFEHIPIQSDSAFAHVEVLAKANFLGHLLAEEVPLAITPRPGPDFRTIWREARRLFRSPDFGPPVLPSLNPPPAATP
jgi:glycosyltransferase involved in cell wall biosynthesis